MRGGGGNKIGVNDKKNAPFSSTDDSLALNFLVMLGVWYQILLIDCCKLRYWAHMSYEALLSLSLSLSAVALSRAKKSSSVLFFFFFCAWPDHRDGLVRQTNLCVGQCALWQSAEQYVSCAHRGHLNILLLTAAGAAAAQTVQALREDMRLFCCNTGTTTAPDTRASV